MRNLVEAGSARVEPTAILVRGGQGRLSDLRRAIAKAEHEFGVAALSVYAGDDVDAVLREAPLWNATVRAARASAVFAEGWDVFYTFDWPHASVLLPDGSDATLARFVDVFDHVADNPYVPTRHV